MREKCYKCMRPKETCLCSRIKPVKTKTKFVILIHPHEFKKVKNNTGRITHLSLENSEFIMGESFKDNKRVNELIRDTNSYILYPGEDTYTAETLPTKENITIFIIDATWPCSRKLLRLSPNLQSLPKISFNPEQKSIYKFKRQPNALALSTIESVLATLKELNLAKIERTNPDLLKSFLDPFKKLIQIQIDYENDPSLDGYRRRNKS